MSNPRAFAIFPPPPRLENPFFLYKLFTYHTGNLQSLARRLLAVIEIGGALDLSAARTAVDANCRVPPLELLCAGLG